MCEAAVRVIRTYLAARPERALRMLGARAVDDALIVRCQLYLELEGADDALNDEPLWLAALRGADDDEAQELALGVATAFGALCPEARACVAERVAAARDHAVPAYLLAAERLMDAVGAHAEPDLVEAMFPTVNAAGRAALLRCTRDYNGDEDLLRVYNNSDTLARIRQVPAAHGDAALFFPELMRPYLPWQRVVEAFLVPVLRATQFGTERAALRYLFVRMLRSVAVEFLGPWCAAWLWALDEADVRANAAELHRLGALRLGDLNHLAAYIETTGLARLRPTPTLERVLTSIARAPLAHRGAYRTFSARAPAQMLRALLLHAPRGECADALLSLMLTIEPAAEHVAATAAVLGVCALALEPGAVRLALLERACERMHACLGVAVATRDGLHAAITGLVRDRTCCRCAPRVCDCGGVWSVHVLARAAVAEAHALVVRRMVAWGMLHRMHLLLELALGVDARVDAELGEIAHVPPSAFARELAAGISAGLEG
jgi:hypothetical protein